MKTYELAYIVSPEITSEEAEAKGKEIESAILSKEGTIVKQLTPIAKTFSHPVGKKASGFWGVLEFQIEPEKLVEFQSDLAKDKTVVRYMISIKRPAEFKKARRTKIKVDSPLPVPVEEKPVVEIEKIEVPVEEKKKSTSKIKEIKEKVELKDIEEELEEILG
jgi:ribosomal protein S6